MQIKTPPFEALLELKDVFNRAQIIFALGGSGLLAHYGLETTVRDWDITTDAPWSLIEPLVKKFEYETGKTGGPFATKYLCKLHLRGASVDLMGEFAIKIPDGIYRIPTLIEGEWNGIPLGSLSVWAKVYELLGRYEKADRIKKYLSTKTPVS